MNVTADLRQALRERYPPPEWVMAYEVQVDGRNDALQFIDAVAFDVRKGAGMAVHGLELKISRADFLNEVRDPGKAEAARALCDYWWIVAGGPGIVKATELPPGVGLITARHDGLGVQEYARLTENGRVLGGLVDRRLMAAVLRRVDPMEPRAYWEARERRAEAKGYAKGTNAGKRVERVRARHGNEPPTLGTGRFCP